MSDGREPRFADRGAAGFLKHADRPPPTKEERIDPTSPAYCRDCDHDTHVCRSCGTFLKHGQPQCGECG